MPRIETIKASQAPSPPKKQSKAASEMVAALNALKRDEVLKIEPDEGKSLRGLKTGIGRIAKNAGIKTRSWDDGEFVYVSKE